MESVASDTAVIVVEHTASLTVQPNVYGLEVIKLLVTFSLGDFCSLCSRVEVADKISTTFSRVVPFIHYNVILHGLIGFGVLELLLGEDKAGVAVNKILHCVNNVLHFI
jgi:hypothetical protein